MSKYSHIITAVSAAAVTAALARGELLSPPIVANAATSCLAVDPGVCFSGTTEWVAATAERLAIPVGAMGSMSGDAL